MSGDAPECVASGPTAIELLVSGITSTKRQASALAWLSDRNTLEGESRETQSNFHHGAGFF